MTLNHLKSYQIKKELHSFLLNSENKDIEFLFDEKENQQANLIRIK